jgi:hypothetical protein
MLDDIPAQRNGMPNAAMQPPPSFQPYASGCNVAEGADQDALRIALRRNDLMTPFRTSTRGGGGRSLKIEFGADFAVGH